MKVANIYDISGRQYLVKFQRGSKKEMVLIESGIRMHTTSYQRDKNQIPSAYSMKVTASNPSAPEVSALQVPIRYKAARDR